MTRDQYIRMTDCVRRTAAHLPGGEKSLKIPTYICAAVYLCTLVWLAVNRDSRLLRAALIPAVTFCLVTVLRKAINRQRPYDRFGAAPVGKWKPGKGKSMPSRHSASAAAIVIAVIYVFPNPVAGIVMTLLGLLISGLRVASGMHYPSDAAAAILAAALIAAVGYNI